MLDPNFITKFADSRVFVILVRPIGWENFRNLDLLLIWQGQQIVF